MLSQVFLIGKSGNGSVLEQYIMKHTSEWMVFEQRMKDCELYDDDGDGTRSLLRDFIRGSCSPDLVQEIRLWASFRAQTLARTIRGAISYHEALATRLKWAKQDEDRSFKLQIGDLVELVISAQTYAHDTGKTPAQKREDRQREEDLDWLLLRYSACPIRVVYDYHKGITSKGEEEAVANFWLRNHGPLSCSKQEEPRCGLDGNPAAASSSQSASAPKKKFLGGIFGGENNKKSRGKQNENSKPSSKHTTNELGENVILPFDHATVFKHVEGEGQDAHLVITAVLPRVFPLVLGKGRNRTQGKAGNHINANRAVWGHVTQVMDANMDGFVGEGFKVPFITHLFHGGARVNRKYVSTRIIGFREYIYTGALGGVAASMAESESTFGTITQRVLDDPLGVRMHYGHPDFFDSFWTFNRGGLSKGSARINLSEDVFAGFNVWLRNEDTSHVDTLEWQKGRETVFTTASMFLAKISAGCVAIFRSRDMLDMNSGLDIVTRLSLMCGGSAYFLTSLLLSISLYLYVITFFLFAVAGITLSDLDLLGSSLSSQWLLGLGFVAFLPFLAEQILERGFLVGLWYSLLHWPSSTLFYLFQNQTVAASVSQGIVTGVASYINTGRPSFFSSYSLTLAYRLYARSHYYPSLTLMAVYLYRLFSLAELAKHASPNNPNAGPSPSEDSRASYPMVMIYMLCACWSLGPVFFCPHISNYETLSQTWAPALTFLFSVKDAKQNDGTPLSLYTFWKEDYIERHYNSSFGTRIFRWTWGLVLVLLCLACGSQTVDGVRSSLLTSFYFLLNESFTLLVLAHLCASIIWRVLFYYNWDCSLVFLLWIPTLLWLITPALVLGTSPFLWDGESVNYNFLLTMFIFAQICRLLSNTIMILCSYLLEITGSPLWDDSKAQSPSHKAYRRLVHACYVLDFTYHTHMYSSTIIFACQLVFHILLVILGSMWRVVFPRKTTEHAIILTRAKIDIEHHQIEKLIGKKTPLLSAGSPESYS